MHTCTQFKSRLRQLILLSVLGELYCVIHIALRVSWFEYFIHITNQGGGMHWDQQSRVYKYSKSHWKITPEFLKSSVGASPRSTPLRCTYTIYMYMHTIHECTCNILYISPEKIFSMKPHMHFIMIRPSHSLSTLYLLLILYVAWTRFPSLSCTVARSN